jgi:hypothetical protein
LSSDAVVGLLNSQNLSTNSDIESNVLESGDDPDEILNQSISGAWSCIVSSYEPFDSIVATGTITLKITRTAIF